MATPYPDRYVFSFESRFGGGIGLKIYSIRGDGAKCGSWVDWYGEVVCDVEQLAHLAGPETIDAESYEGSAHS